MSRRRGAVNPHRRLFKARHQAAHCRGRSSAPSANWPKPNRAVDQRHGRWWNCKLWSAASRDVGSIRPGSEIWRRTDRQVRQRHAMPVVVSRAISLFDEAMKRDAGREPALPAGKAGIGFDCGLR